MKKNAKDPTFLKWINNMCNKEDAEVMAIFSKARERARLRANYLAKRVAENKLKRKRASMSKKQ